MQSHHILILINPRHYETTLIRVKLLIDRPITRRVTRDPPTLYMALFVHLLLQSDMATTAIDCCCASATVSHHAPSATLRCASATVSHHAPSATLRRRWAGPRLGQTGPARKPNSPLHKHTSRLYGPAPELGLLSSAAREKPVASPS
jgi:hypothetical protein